MKRVTEWGFPIAVIAAWMIASVYTAISLHGMENDWRSRRATVSAAAQG
jgi:hypothetical protein